MLHAVIMVMCARIWTVTILLIMSNTTTDAKSGGTVMISFLIRYIAVVYFGFMVVVSFLNIVLGEKPRERIMSIINFCASIVAIYFITH